MALPTLTANSPSDLAVSNEEAKEEQEDSESSEVEAFRGLQPTEINSEDTIIDNVGGNIIRSPFIWFKQ